MILRHIFTLRGLQSSCRAMGTAFFGMSAWYLEKDHFVAFGRFRGHLDIGKCAIKSAAISAAANAAALS